jgi:hypothetical protein
MNDKPPSAVVFFVISLTGKYFWPDGRRCRKTCKFVALIRQKFLLSINKSKATP